MTHAIAVTGLSKRYTLHHQGRPRYESLRELLAEGARSLAQRAFAPRNDTQGDFDEEFWALKDVSFTVEPGERLGVIGRNGAGKSTLLKILSRITEPTEGRIEIRGRVSSLLEVGTGFHPELTGRENVYLNGTILGMSSRYIRRKFDEIVAFAEIERFLDTPVKRYSSGMYVRLAFAVAAHLEPDILIIDEVLAVGDARFQKKCLGKMREVTGEGRTVLFVSHNMTSVTSLCDRCILLEGGKVRADGASSEVTSAYFAAGNTQSGSDHLYTREGKVLGDDVAQLCRARLVDRSDRTVDYVRLDSSIGVEMTFRILEGGHRLIPNVHVFSRGEQVFVSMPVQSKQLPAGVYRSTMWIPSHFLNEGLYVVGVALSSMTPIKGHFFDPEALYFTALDDLDDPYRNEYINKVPGFVRPRLEWHVEEVVNP